MTTDNWSENSIKAVRTDAFAELKFLKQHDTAVRFKRAINVTCQSKTMLQMKLRRAAY